MSLLRLLSLPLAPLYGSVVRARNRRFDARPDLAARLPVPVVSVGNLSTGGTGKTPVTLFLAEGLEAAGLPNLVLSRGYRGKRDVDPMSVEPDSAAAQTGDEPLLMARRLGPGRVVVGRSRHAAGLRALAQRPEARCLVLDDGYQHRALHRDLDLLLLDGVRLWGDGHMLPRGDLREPMAEARRAHALVVTRAGRVKDPRAVQAWWEAHGSGGPLFWVDFGIAGLRDWASGERHPLPTPEPALAWCALGHPEAFYADLLVAGQPWTDTFSLPDHRAASPAQLRALAHRARQHGLSRLVCTEKDAVKLGPAHAEALDGLPLLIAEQGLQGGEPLLHWVRTRLEGLASAPALA